MNHDLSETTQLVASVQERSPRPRIAVLGAGLQGACVALAAAQLGFRVDLFDHLPAVFSGASLHNEGKVHLGLVYASDPRGRTPRLMVEGALSFGRVLEHLTGVAPSVYVSPHLFTYGLPVGSQIDADGFEEHCTSVMELVRHGLERPGNDYLGVQEPAAIQRLDDREFRAAFDDTTVTAAWRTPEAAADTRCLARAIQTAVSNQPAIRFRGGCEIVSATGSSDSVAIEFIETTKSIRERYDAAVNCLWEGRLAIDQSFGLATPTSVLHRYKAYVRFEAEPLPDFLLPSCTLVQGPYGDLVHYGNGHYYLSWYPTFRLGATDAVDGRSLHGLLDTVSPHDLLDTGLVNMTRYLPALRGLRPVPQSLQVGGGVIVARANSDIDDAKSGLHARAEIGPEMHGRYITVESGKLTTAPAFAEAVQQELSRMFGVENFGARR